MFTKLFLGFSLLGAEWVMFLLILISVFSVTLMFERSRFYSKAQKGLAEFRKKVREAILVGEWDLAREIVKHRKESTGGAAADLETELAGALLAHTQSRSVEVLGEIGNDSVLSKKILWDQNLATLATIGNNAPFVGLFGTVLGVIKAFHDLSQQTANTGGVTGVMGGISESLVATGLGILVAIPAVIAYNTFQKKTKVALMNAESLKSFIVGQITSRKGD